MSEMRKRAKLLCTHDRQVLNWFHTLMRNTQGNEKEGNEKEGNSAG